MNFLGHLYLSGSDPLVTVGNFMADAVKGSDLSRFPAGVQAGIRLHRAIDSYTDEHPLFRTGRARVRTHAGRYAGVVMDLFYDHLLASHWQHWHPEPLPQFAQRMYSLLHSHAHLLPERMAFVLKHMHQGDWLSSYAEMSGLRGALQGMARRAPQGGSMAGAEVVLVQHLEAYRAEFTDFLPQIGQHLRSLS
ncbi:MAG: DUF479 domain-containing protein [Flavobacteriales bacterium]|nr:DUF479 domain-containing protein [Flavobacteriales bacterium]